MYCTVPSESKRKKGGEYDNINCGIGWNMQCTPYEKGYNDGLYCIGDKVKDLSLSSSLTQVCQWSRKKDRLKFVSTDLLIILHRNAET